MKLGVVTLVLSVSMVFAGSVLAETTTAVGALKALGRDRGEAFRANVLQVIGIGGGDQPPVWRIITRDPFQVGAIRDFAVEKGRVVGDQFVPPAYHSNIPSTVLREENLRMDSKAVFLIADDCARRAKIGFYTLDYEVRSADGGGGIWIVRLKGAYRGRVGELLVSATNGAVLRERWWQPQRVPSGDAAQKKSRSNSESIGEQITEGWNRARRGLSQGKDEVKRNAEQAGQSVQSFFREVFASEAGRGGIRSEAAYRSGYGYRGTGSGAAAVDNGRYH